MELLLQAKKNEPLSLLRKIGISIFEIAIVVVVLVVVL